MAIARSFADHFALSSRCVLRIERQAPGGRAGGRHHGGLRFLNRTPRRVGDQ